MSGDSISLKFGTLAEKAHWDRASTARPEDADFWLRQGVAAAETSLVPKILAGRYGRTLAEISMRQALTILQVMAGARRGDRPPDEDEQLFYQLGLQTRGWEARDAFLALQGFASGALDELIAMGASALAATSPHALGLPPQLARRRALRAEDFGVLPAPRRA